MPATLDRLRDICTYATGIEHYYTSETFPGYMWSDGVNAFVEEADSQWLLDTIFSYLRDEHFQVWDLEVFGKEATGKNHAELTMRCGTGMTALVRHTIPDCNIPKGHWEFYLMDGVLFLTSEQPRA